MSPGNDVRHISVKPRGQSEYILNVGPGVLARIGTLVRSALPESVSRIAIFSNQRVFNLYGDPAVKGLNLSGYKTSVLLIPDGEKYKTLATSAAAINFLSGQFFSRNDAILALGGGVVGDLAGFTAAIYMRGIPYINAPTTLMAQIDAAIGGKTGVNTGFAKNLIGAFHHPNIVLSDTMTLRSLPAREVTAGLCEAIKQGAIAGLKLFDQTRRFIVSRAFRNAGHRLEEPGEESLVNLICAHCIFKARVIAKDERERISAPGQFSRTMLNFGHTVAHALEAVTKYRRFRHGEAVGYGIIVASEISTRLGLLDPGELQLIRESVRQLGPLPRADDLELGPILNAVKQDKKGKDGHPHWVLLERIGKPRLLSGKEIQNRVIRLALQSGLKSEI